MATRKTRSKKGASGPVDPPSGPVDPEKPAGNAQFDPREQTFRQDMPAEQQESAGEPARGSGPVRSDDPRLPGRPEQGAPGT